MISDKNRGSFFGCQTNQNYMLFKYVRRERVDILEKLRIRFTPASEFTDPFEFMPDTSVLFDPKWLKEIEENLVKKALRIAKPKPGVTRHQLEVALRAQVRNIHKEMEPEAAADFVAGLASVKQALRVLCLSRLAPDSPDALLMWAHYTDGHTGFVLGLDDSHPWIAGHQLTQPLRDLGAVSYESARPKSKMGAHERSYYLVKSDHWRYEAEVRMVRGEADPDLDSNSLAKLPRDVILSVTLGLSASQATQDAVSAALKVADESATVRLFRARFHADEYRIVLDEIPRL